MTKMSVSKKAYICWKKKKSHGCGSCDNAFLPRVGPRGANFHVTRLRTRKYASHYGRVGDIAKRCNKSHNCVPSWFSLATTATYFTIYL